MEQHEDEILDRLEELRVWQEQQQNSPLTEAQIKLMQHLGLSFDNENILENASVNGTEEDDCFFENIEKQIHALRSGNSSMRSHSLDDTPVMSRKVFDFAATPLKSIDLDRIQVDDAPNDELPRNAKRPFLKKGEGLTNRFKVNPDYFNLKNLPKYKFAKRNQTPTATYNEAESVNRLHKSESARKLNLDNQKQSINRSKSASAVLKKKNAWPENDVLHKEQPRKEKFRLSAESSMNKLKTYQTELDGLVSLEGSEKEASISNGYETNTEEDNQNQYNHVQFDSHVEVDAEHSDHQRFDKFSTPTSKSFSEFKAQLLASTTGLSADETLKEDYFQSVKKESVDVKEYLKQLQELECQIKTFQKENSNLIKMKKQHELERMKMRQEQEEFEEKLNDERVKMEVYFHDERMKIKEKHENLDRRIKEVQRPTRKERDEVMRLNEKIAHLEAESKAKEVKHGSAQARLRSQIKQLEKQVTEQKIEIDVLKRDNKRLDTENLRLRRENNGKVLNEINKNIAKLATTTSQTESTAQKKEILNRSRSTVVAKVVSHSGTGRRSKTPTDVKPPPPEESDIDSDVENDNNWNGSSSFFPMNSNKSNDTLSQNNNRNMTLNFTGDRKENINPDGSKDVWYPNGNIKKISADGMVIRMIYFNKDIKETNINEGTVKYYFAENNTWQTTYSDGKQVLEFPNGQIEHRHKNGRLEAHFPNGTIKIIDPTTKEITEKWTYPDGTKVHVFKNDDRILYLPNGHREIHTKTHKRREFPDGAVKIVHNDGSTETRFPDGRIRVKDKDGNLTMDTSGVS